MCANIDCRTMVATLKPVSWIRMNEAVENVRRRLLSAAQALDEAGVDYAVVGGNAVAAWVSRVDESAVRNTRDVDILLRRCDLDRAALALGSKGFVQRRVDALGKAAHMDVFLDGPKAKVRDAIHILYSSEKSLPDSQFLNAEVSESEPSAGFRLINLGALTRMKLAAWRDKDRVHLRDLASVGLLDHSWISQFEGTLQERLQHILDTPDE